LFSLRPLSLTLSPKEKGDTTAKLRDASHQSYSAKSLSFGEGLRERSEK